MNYELYFVSALLTNFSEGVSGVFCLKIRANSYYARNKETTFSFSL